METAAAAALGPEEPSSPDFAELFAPTPTGIVEGSPAASTGVIQRPGDSPWASTSAPLRGEFAPAAITLEPTHIPSIQRRVAACLSEVDVAEPEQPFIPHGCPFTIHNPFTSRSQCRILSEAMPTPQALRTVLSDFSSRRGWQPLVSVQPQPDDASVHLIPAAASPSLASVLLRDGAQLQPLCATRDAAGQVYRRIVLNGRHGRLREPYSLAVIM